jgi:hypothetical protein
MKYLFKILSIFTVLVSHFAINFHPIQIRDVFFLPKNLSDNHPICTLNKTTISDFSANPSSDNKITFDKVVKVKLNVAEPNKRSCIITKVKTFRQNNDIHFNLPLTNYKFSLREYTEGN